jgi:hypothetical protein
MDDQRREPLNPPEQSHLVDLDAAFGERLLQIPVGQSVAQAPANGDQDDLWRESEPGERRPERLNGSNEVSALYSDSLACQRPRGELRRVHGRSRSMQQCAYRLNFPA